ncbi:uncharacterized protein EI90DRAFT_2972490 [Cantharellus anzutake]|uniref:uncharacterized protein n=1 Tax=Cantharellus anzutake TaxID=1750568 RepID=UPI0019049344|nr:uncharacterized protein EI90DRAFT_2972490 [Cantharellus anzutake]KAF8331355.1 hypothetical protein EI90DRAFT_2972490 [Cantharellus anzutake]
MSALNALRGSNSPMTAPPTVTTYPGNPNYRADSFKPLSNGKPVPTPMIDGRQVPRTHYEELNLFLANHMAKEPAGARASAREKLTRLTRQQFQELSTDVYDELVRRKNNSTKNEVPFLPVRDDFHPKRNQARQKLATLPKSRFKDLSSDVFVELGRRYPELKEDENPAILSTPGSTYDDPSSPDQLNSPSAANKPHRQPTSSVPSDVSPPPHFYSQGARSRPSVDTANEFQPGLYRSTPDLPQGSLGYRQEASPEPSLPTQRKPSGDSEASTSYNRQPSQSQEIMAAYPQSRRKPSQEANNANISTNSINTSTSLRKGSNESSAISSSQGPSSATAGVIIPNKSTIAEEVIEVPFGREEDSPSLSSRPGTPEGGADPNGMRASIQSSSTRTAGAAVGPGLRSSPDSLRLSSKSPLERLGGQAQSFGGAVGGLNALSQGLLGSSRSEDEEGTMSERRAGSDYYEKLSFGRTSVASDVSGKGGRTRQSLEDAEKLRSDYEFKIATMQTRMASLEGALTDSARIKAEDVERIRQLETELALMKESSVKQATENSRLQGALNGELDSKEQNARRADADAQRISELQDRIVVLESELGNGGVTPDVEALRDEMQGLVDTLSDMSARIEQMMEDKDADMTLIQTLTEQVKEYKRKYEQAKTELRNMKATSQLFSGPQVPKVDARRIPISENGVIADIHVTAFQGAIDTLLSLARSDNPGNVLMSMKAVVNAVATITDDVKAFERRPTRLDVSEDAIRHLRERADATLSNLVSAARNHASGFGLSPVSLMDAAASHVSATIIDLVKLLSLRRASLNERDSTRSPTRHPNGSSPAPFIPSLRSVDEAKPGMQRVRTSSSSSGSLREDLTTRNYSERPGRAISQSPSYSQMADGNGRALVGEYESTNESLTMDGGEDAWEELKPYLEVQSESIVYSIQSLLSAIRKGSQMSELNENLTQIITIASSIVAVCKDSLPPAITEQGTEILQDLSKNCDQLSEMQSLTEITKQTRQTMASASFGVAKAMKELMKL